MADETLTTDTTTSTSSDTVTTDTTVAPVDTASTDTSTDTSTTSDESTVLGGDTSTTDTTDTSTEATGAPETYALALKAEDGTDIALDETLVGEATEVFRALNLTNEQANTLLPLAPKLMEQAQTATIQQVIDAGNQQRKDWLDAFKADPDIGGANEAKSAELAAQGLDAMGFTKDHPFRVVLNETGFGNHPDVIRTFRKLGELVAEDGTFARPNAGGETKQAGWDSLYKD